MLHVRITCPADLAEQAVEAFKVDPAVSNVVHMPGVAVQPEGDVVLADVAREGANEVIDHLRELGVHKVGSLQVEPVNAWLSQRGYDAERHTPGSSADSVVWLEVTQQAYEESELNWTFLSFMTLATVLASIAIVIDSPILVIGAMVLGPEFTAIAALGLALVRRRVHLFGVALRALVVGFVVAIAITFLAVLAARGLGWITLDDVHGARPGTAFIYRPDKWSFIVAVIAAAAGVLSLTSAKVGGLSGVFISVTTIPAAGNIALGLAFGVREEVWGSTVQLTLNLAAMVVAGWLTLALQQALWQRVSAKRVRLLQRWRNR